MIDKETTLADLEQKLRGKINRPRTYYGLRQARGMWNVICCALDVIGDTEAALFEFLEGYDSVGIGTRYIFAYGIFQVLQTQQDAVRALCRTFQVSERINRDLVEIRQLRAKSVAHPTNHKEDGVNITGFISRSLLSIHKFRLSVAYDDGRESEYISVDIADLIRRQREYLKTPMVDILRVIEEEDRRHLEGLTTMKLKDIFHPTIDYMMGHVEMAVIDYSEVEMALGDLNHLQGIVTKYAESLRERGEQYASSVDGRVALALYSIKRLREHFGGVLESLSKQDAEIFASWLRKEFVELEREAADIDQSYEEGRA